MVEGRAVESLYLDRLPWEDVYENVPQSEIDRELVRTNVVFLVGADLDYFADISGEKLEMLNAVWTGPESHSHFANYWIPATQQFVQGLPWWEDRDHWWSPATQQGVHVLSWWGDEPSGAGSNEVTPGAENDAILEFTGSPEEREDASVHSSDWMSNNEPSTYEETTSDSLTESAPARKTKHTTINYKARLSLLPRFVKEVFTHPFSDFTLLRRGNEVFVVEKGADFSGKDLSGADLHSANLQEADLRGTNFSHAVLTNSNLRGANLEDAILDHTDLSYADLRGANVKPDTLSLAITEGALLDTRSRD
jgi:hypothetical protein